ncbi:MAG: CDP-alcohol phosphatidyltransferase family protein [Gammaproteobacteria bacterium]|jgi:phosphatidylglycerophosphate synthase|nr:CDP-alcohol phosphatidyltransferase family protein [Gammaproteobacteria bacterium]
MSCYIHVFDEPPLLLWGLSSSQRIRGELEWELSSLKRERSASVPHGSIEFVDHLEELPAEADVVLIRGDYLYDVRIIANLIAAMDTLLLTNGEGTGVAVAAHTGAAAAIRVREYLRGNIQDLPATLRLETPDTLVPETHTRLKKAHAAVVLPINKDNSRDLERYLFKNAYKGITDLVTKWVWPAPARWVTKLCVRFGLLPNHVTAFSWVLAILTGILFYQGEFAGGLISGWLMTFLDTVDGKLARVTVTSSPLGNYFDHILDLLHPPFWYLAWGLGLASFTPAFLNIELAAMIVLIFAGYIIGRVVEGVFSWMAKFGIYSWRPLDSFNRLITARRNPCLIILTISLLPGRPDLGLEAVALWTLLSSLFLVVRLAMGIYTRATKGPLQPWLAEIDLTRAEQSLAVRWFTQ